MENTRFCKCCDYAIDEMAIRYARENYECPSCHTELINDFYSYGSTIHKERRRKFDDGELYIHHSAGGRAPLPLPQGKP